MTKITNQPFSYINCIICGEMIGEHAPAVDFSYGFCEGEDFYVEESIVSHAECCNDNLLTMLMEKILKN